MVGPDARGTVGGLLVAGLLLGVFLVAIGPTANALLDTAGAAAIRPQDEAVFAAYESAALRDTGTLRVLVLGSSVTKLAFDADLAEQLLPGVRFFDLATSNDTPSRRIYEVPAILTLRPDAVVIEASYQSFSPASDERARVAAVAARHPGGQAEAALSDPWVVSELEAHGVRRANANLGFEESLRVSRARLREGIEASVRELVRSGCHADDYRDKTVCIARRAPDDPTRDPIFRAIASRPISNDSVSLLVSIASRLADGGMDVYIVAPPVDERGEAALPTAVRAGYARGIERLAAVPGATLVDLRATAAHEDFHDFHHMTATGGRRYTERLVAYLDEV